MPVQTPPKPRGAAQPGNGALNVERRTFSAAEVRLVEPDDGSPRIEGYAAVFEQLSEPMFGFREKIAQGAFKRTLKAGADVRALWNHDPNFVLGRARAGTLSLREDQRGLAVEIDPPEAAWAGDLLESMRRGDVDQMSFGFQVVKDSWEDDGRGGLTRTLNEVRLFDVSVVTFPAYPQTSADVRASAFDSGLELEQLGRSLVRVRVGVADENDYEVLRQARSAIEDCLPDPRQEAHSGPESTEPMPRRSIALLRRRLIQRSREHGIAA